MRAFFVGCLFLGACTSQSAPPPVCEPAFEPRRGPSGSGGVLLQDIHLERGMYCIDCHQLQDSHGDGNLYRNDWVDQGCASCHGPVPLR